MSILACPACGSQDMHFPGHCSYHWSNGKWRVVKNSHHMADTNVIHCGGCGKTWQIFDLNPPFELEEDRTLEELYLQRR